MPPTPTPFPPGMAHFTLPDNYSLWGSADLAIQTWNWLGDWRLIIQAIFLVVLIAAGMYLFKKFIEQFTRDDAEE